MAHEAINVKAIERKEKNEMYVIRTYVSLALRTIWGWKRKLPLAGFTIIIHTCTDIERRRGRFSMVLIKFAFCIRSKRARAAITRVVNRHKWLLAVAVCTDGRSKKWTTLPGLLLSENKNLYVCLARPSAVVRSLCQSCHSQAVRLWLM